MTTGTGAFSTSNNVVSSTSPIEVGIAPAAGSTFVPLLLLQKGVQFNTTDATGTFTTTGAVSGYTGNTTISLLDNHAHTFEAPALLGSGYYALPTSDTNGADLAVAGGDLTVTGLHFANQELDVQGTLSLANFPGLNLTVAGTDHVALTSSGVQLASLNDTLAPSTNFSDAGLSFSTTNVQVQYDSATNAFDLSGSAMLTVARNKLTLNLGSPTAPGLVIANDALQSLDAAVTGDIAIAGLTITATGLTIKYDSTTSTTDFTITGDASFMLGSNTVDINLVGNGIDINNGQLVSLDATVNSNITIAGLTVTAKNLTINYQSASATSGTDVMITGDATLAFGKNTFSLALTGNGIDIHDGSLQSLDASVTGSITVAGLTVTATDLTINYQSASANSGTDIMITGGASFTLDGNTVSLSLTGNGIDIHDGALQRLNASVNGNISIAGLTVTLTNLSVQYDSTTDSIMITGSA